MRIRLPLRLGSIRDKGKGDEQNTPIDTNRESQIKHNPTHQHPNDALIRIECGARHPLAGACASLASTIADSSLNEEENPIGGRQGESSKTVTGIEEEEDDNR